METKSPTPSVKSREIIGTDQFSQRREVFDKHDTVFLPPASPTLSPAYQHAEPILTSNHAKTTTNFKRNTPGYSSMREPRDRDVEFRARKYSDNFTSELNQNDDVDYRSSMTERTRRLSKLRRDFLNSNLHEPGAASPFARSGTRASMPASSVSALKYKIESPNLYKFPFAEPYATPPPVRKVIVDLGPSGVNGEKENQDPEAVSKHQSLPNNRNSPKPDHQALYEELLKRYSPQRMPVDWKIPPTRPRVVGSVPKSTSSMTDTVDSADKGILENCTNKADDDVFVKTEKVCFQNTQKCETDQNSQENDVNSDQKEVKENSEVKSVDNKNEDPKSLAELEERNDKVAALSSQLEKGESADKTPAVEKYIDMTLPALLDKMSEDGQKLEHKKQSTQKVKRKRSFLDKLLGRKKDK